MQGKSRAMVLILLLAVFASVSVFSDALQIAAALNIGGSIIAAGLAYRF